MVAPVNFSGRLIQSNYFMVCEQETGMLEIMIKLKPLQYQRTT